MHFPGHGARHLSNLKARAWNFGTAYQGRAWITERPANAR
jgi:hypothetical protein